MCVHDGLRILCVVVFFEFSACVALRKVLETRDNEALSALSADAVYNELSPDERNAYRDFVLNHLKAGRSHQHSVACTAAFYTTLADKYLSACSKSFSLKSSSHKTCLCLSLPALYIRLSLYNRREIFYLHWHRSFLDNFNGPLSYRLKERENKSDKDKLSSDIVVLYTIRWGGIRSRFLSRTLWRILTAAAGVLSKAKIVRIVESRHRDCIRRKRSIDE